MKPNEGKPLLLMLSNKVKHVLQHVLEGKLGNTDRCQSYGFLGPFTQTSESQSAPSSLLFAGARAPTHPSQDTSRPAPSHAAWLLSQLVNEEKEKEPTGHTFFSVLRISVRQCNKPPCVPIPGARQTGGTPAPPLPSHSLISLSERFPPVAKFYRADNTSVHHLLMTVHCLSLSCHFLQ